MLHNGHRQPPSKKRPDPTRIITRRINHKLTPHRPLRRIHPPLPALTGHPSNRTKAHNRHPLPPSRLSQSLRQLRRIDIPIRRIPLPAIQIMRLQKRIQPPHLIGPDLLKRNPQRPPHRLHMSKLLHPLSTMSQPQRPRHMIINRRISLPCQPSIQSRRIRLHLQNRPRSRIIRTIPGGVPSGTGSQLIPLQQNDIPPPQQREMPSHRTPDRPAANNDHTRLFRKRTVPAATFRHSIPCRKIQPSRSDRFLPIPRVPV